MTPRPSRLLRRLRNLVTSRDRLITRDHLTARNRAQQVAELDIVCHPDTWHALHHGVDSLRPVPDHRVQIDESGTVAVITLTTVDLTRVFADNILTIHHNFNEPQKSLYFHLHCCLEDALLDGDGQPAITVPDRVSLLS